MLYTQFYITARMSYQTYMNTCELNATDVTGVRERRQERFLIICTQFEDKGKQIRSRGLSLRILVCCKPGTNSTNSRGPLTVRESILACT